MNAIANTLTPGLDALHSGKGLDRLHALLDQLNYRELMALQHRVLQRMGEHQAKNTGKPGTGSRVELIQLTAREAEVLTLVANGYTRREVGEALSISCNTAATHISTIYRKLDVSTIAEATALAIRWGLVS